MNEQSNVPQTEGTQVEVTTTKPEKKRNPMVAWFLSVAAMQMQPGLLRAFLAARGRRATPGKRENLNKFAAAELKRERKSALLAYQAASWRRFSWRPECRTVWSWYADGARTELKQAAK